MYGLIIKKKWLDLIMSGKKSLEIRSSDTKHQGERIYLLESGSHKVRGTCIIDSTFPLSCSDWCEEADNHLVDISYKELLKVYKSPHAWVLKKIQPIDKDAYYEHKKGSVIWIKDVNIIEI
jgi:hypothetical protein